MTLATEPRPAQLPLPGGRPGATVRLHPILTGELHAPRSYIERPQGRLVRERVYLKLAGRRRSWVWLPVPAFLVEHPSVGVVLILSLIHISEPTRPY